MAITLPLPVRVAAGILGAGIDLLRALPDDVPAIPVTIVGNAMRLSLKVQQEIASLATRGDELLGAVIGAPEESPTWAKFDDDDEPAKPVTPIRPAARAGSGSKVVPGSAAVVPKSPVVPRSPVVPKSPPSQSSGTEDHDFAGAATGPSATADESSQPADDDAPTLTTPETTAMPPVTTTAMDAAIEVPQSVIDSATIAAEDAVPTIADPIGTELAEAELVETVLAADELTDVELAADVADLLDDADLADADLADPGPDGTDSPPVPTSEVGTDDVDALRDALPDELTDGPEAPVIFEETEELTETLPIPDGLIEEVEAAADGPAALPDYDRMTLAQVRGHLRELSSEDVSALLRYEQDGENRAPFLTLLSNRLVTLDAQHP